MQYFLTLFLYSLICLRFSFGCRKGLSLGILPLWARRRRSCRRVAARLLFPNSSCLWDSDHSFLLLVTRSYHVSFCNKTKEGFQDVGPAVCNGGLCSAASDRDQVAFRRAKGARGNSRPCYPGMRALRRLMGHDKENSNIHHEIHRKRVLHY